MTSATARAFDFDGDNSDGGGNWGLTSTIKFWHAKLRIPAIIPNPKTIPYPWIVLPGRIEIANPASGTAIKVVKLAALLRKPKYRPRKRWGTKAAIQLNHEEVPKPARMLLAKIVTKVKLTNWWELVLNQTIQQIPAMGINHNSRAGIKVHQQKKWRLLLRSAKYAPNGCSKLVSIGIEESIPTSRGFAPNWSKKLVSKTPLVTLEKMAAKTPSIVEALRLVRRTGLEIIGGWWVVVNSVTAARGCVLLRADKVSTRIE